MNDELMLDRILARDKFTCPHCGKTFRYSQALRDEGSLYPFEVVG
jgi:predicted RNA-binding Zn-ribbon protein involved in translation (DUF1610 family)